MAVQSPKKSSTLPWPALIPLGHHAGKPAISLQKMVILVGSRHNAHLHLLSRHVSKAHALILSYGGSVYIRDLASREQVYINGVPEREAWLQNGDLVKIGSFTFKYREGPTPGDGPEGDAPPHQADLEISGSDSPLAIAEKVMLIGRRTTCDVSLMEASVSTAHAVIFHVGGVRYIRDLGSRTGTFVNGTKVHQHPLSLGDSIKVGETEMHYVLSSEHEHAIAPATAEIEAVPQDEMDELEDLVGTAPLDMAAEIQRDGQILPADLEADLRGMFGAGGLAEATPAAKNGDDDLIELEIAHEPQRAKKEFPRPQPRAIVPPPPPPAPVAEEPIELEPEADEPAATPEPVAAAEPVEPEFAEIDLSTDPDVTEQPASAADTRAIGMDFHAEPPKPTISDQVVDALPPEPAEASVTDEAPVETGAVPLDATLPDDLLPAEASDTASVTQPGTEEDEGISPRGGWQGMSRAESDALPVVETPIDEARIDEEAGDEAPVVEAPIEQAAIDQAPAVEAPVVETPVEASQAVADEALAESLTSDVAEVVPAEPVAPDVEDVALPEVVEGPSEKKGRGRKAKAEPKKGKGGRKSKKQQELERQEAEAAASSQTAPIEPTVTEDVPATEAVAHEPAMEPATEAAQAAEAIEAAATPAVEETFVAPPAVAQTDDEALAIDGPWREGHREPIVETTEPAPVRADEAASEAVSIPEPIADIPPVEVAGEIAPLDENIEEPVAQGEPPAGIDAPAVTLVPEIVSDQVAEEAPPTAEVTDAVIAATPAGEPADAPEALSALDDLGDLDDMPPLEAFAPEADAPATEMEHAPTPSAEPVAEVEEALEEVTALDEDGENSGLDGGDESVHASADDLLSGPAGAPLNEGEPGAAAIAAEDDFFAGMDETLPVLELDSGGDLGPMTSGRDPDALLALDQIDMEGLEDIEVIEPTEPTLDSALGLDIDADEDVAAPATDDSSLTDSQFGRQVEAFASSANGEIVEDLPEIEAVEDPDEALANALSAPEEDADALADAQTTPEGLGAAGDNGAYAHTDTTAGGIEPLTMGMVADAAAVAGQQFEAAGDAVSLATPGVAEADAVVGAQAFVADANGQHVDDPESGDELDDQSFVAEGDAHAPAVETIEPETPAAQPIGAERQDNGQHADDPGARPPAAVAVPAPRAPQGGGGGGGGGGQGFVIGTDLSSFIGGMPLVLPNLPPPPQSAFGRVQVSFAGAKAPWEQAKRPSFPMGQSLAEEVTDAARGLRDVEALDAELESHGISRLSVPKTEEENELDGLGEGAPGDEWNVAAALEDDDDEQALAEWPGPAATDAATADVATGDPATGNITVGEPQELTAHAAPETLAQLPAQDQLESSSATEELAGEPVESEEPLEELELDSQPEAEEPLAELELDSEAIDEDELLKELEVEDLSPVEPLSLESEAGAQTQAPVAHDAGAMEEIAPVEETTAEAAEAEAPMPEIAEEPIAEAPVFEAPAPMTAPVEPEPVVDRSPPPPTPPPTVAPPPVAAAAAAPPRMMPPPPARTLRGGRKGAEAPPVVPPPPPPEAAPLADDAMDGGAIFGSMEFGGVREVDVFAQGSPGAPGPGARALANDAAEQGSGAMATEGRRPQRVIVPPRMGVVGQGAATIEYEASGGGEPLTRPAYRVIPKRNVARRVLLVVLLMLVCMGLAIAGIFYFMHPPQTTRGELQFQKTGALTQFQLNQLRQEQLDRLASPAILLDARSSVVAMQAPAGFLEDPIRFARGIRAEFPEKSSVMTVSYTGPADPNNRQRLYALLYAMFTESHADLDKELKLKRDIATLEKRIAEANSLKAQREELRKAVDAAPGPDEIQRLEAKAREADSAYDMAVAGVKDAQMAVRAAEEQLPAGERSLGAGDPEKKAAADAELAALQKSLADATARAAAVKGAASEEADAKRKMLDQAIELFQQSAAGLMKEDPQLAQYVQSVQQLQEQTHKLSGDLIEVQQQQHKRLSALKKDVDDRVQARQAELWANDKSLGELRAQLDLAQRKYNAAVDLNYPTDSPELKRALADIRELSGRIDARKMALGNDPIVTSVADGLAEMINITKERLEADRARIEKDIKDQERMFAQSNMVERLPETQRAQAAALKAKQEAINDLRKQYAAALDKRTAESNAALRDIEGQVSSVTAKIDERKRLLAADNAKNLTQQQEADRKANLAKAQAALKQADERAATARQAYAQASRALTSAAARTTERTEKQQQLEAIDQSLASTLDQAKQDERALESLNDQLKTLVTIVQPSEANIRVDEGRDDRWLYSAGAVVGLAVLFGILAVVSVAGGDGTARRGSTGEEDDAEAGPLAIHEIGSHQSIAG